MDDRENMKTLFILSFTLSLSAHATVYKKDLKNMPGTPDYLNRQIEDQEEHEKQPVVIVPEEQPAKPALTRCPDGTFVKGECIRAPDGTYR